MDPVFVCGGRPTTVDEAGLRGDVENAAARLLAANAPMRAFARRLEEHVGRFCLALCRTPDHIHRYAGEDAGATARSRS